MSTWSHFLEGMGSVLDLGGSISNTWPGAHARTHVHRASCAGCGTPILMVRIDSWHSDPLCPWCRVGEDIKAAIAQVKDQGGLPSQE